MLCTSTYVTAASLTCSEISEFVRRNYIVDVALSQFSFLIKCEGATILKNDDVKRKLYQHRSEELVRQSVPFLLVMIPCPVNATPKTSAYKIAVRGRAPLDTAPCPGRVSPLEEMIRRYADKPIR